MAAPARLKMTLFMKTRYRTNAGTWHSVDPRFMDTVEGLKVSENAAEFWSARFQLRCALLEGLPSELATTGRPLLARKVGYRKRTALFQNG